MIISHLEWIRFIWTAFGFVIISFSYMVVFFVDAYDTIGYFFLYLWVSASFCPFGISFSSSIGFIRSLSVFFSLSHFFSLSFALFRFHSLFLFFLTIIRSLSLSFALSRSFCSFSLPSLSFALIRSNPFSLAQCLFHSSYSTKMALYRMLARNLGSIAFQ